MKANKWNGIIIVISVIVAIAFFILDYSLGVPVSNSLGFYILLIGAVFIPALIDIFKKK